MGKSRWKFSINPFSTQTSDAHDCNDYKCNAFTERQLQDFGLLRSGQDQILCDRATGGLPMCGFRVNAVPILKM